MKPHITLVTLGVSDLRRSIAFYRDGLGLPRRAGPEDIAFFETRGTWLSLYLCEHGAYVLHALLGENDEEFQVAGHAALVTDAAERRAVHDAIPFQAFDRDDPIFRFALERALWVFWERVGQPDTRAVRRCWPRAGS